MNISQLSKGVSYTCLTLRYIADTRAVRLRMPAVYPPLKCRTKNNMFKLATKNMDTPST